MPKTIFIKSKTPGGDVFVEVDVLDGYSQIQSASSDDANNSSFEKSTKKLKDNAEFVINELKTLGLDEIEISCGLKMGVEGGNNFWGLAKVSSEANFTITAKWKMK